MSRVLVVEDKDENAYYLQVLLESQGWTVEVARHGAEALVKARMHPPGLVVSDLLMPVMDGYTLLRHWKVDARLQAIPFIVYTATYTDASDERLALELGADAFILKPAEPAEFMARLTEVMARAPSMPPRQPSASPDGDPAMLELYSDTLIRKLEEKSLQLADSNASLRHEQEELRLRDRALQAVSQGIVIADARLPDQPIIFVNQGFTRMTGYGAEEAVGRNCRFLQGEGTDRDTVRELRERIAEGVSCSVEIQNYRKDGHPFWNRLTVAPVTDGEGKLSHFVGVQDEITERRSLEHQLRQSQKMEAVGRLAGGIAHDFNNLLSVILTYADLLLTDLPPGAAARPDLEEIRRAGQRAADLTHQLLAFSRQQVLQPRVIDIGETVVAMDRMLRRMLGEDITLVLSPSPEGTRAYADPSQVEQIVMNLAVNARDAMPRGGRLLIETQLVELGPSSREVPPGSYVVLVVSDTGTGMDTQTRERIFEPFFTTKEKGKGTGLGLSTVFGIVEQSQGHIRVTTAVGHGTTFKIYLPRRAQEAAAQATRPPPAMSLVGSETILLVEDDDQVRISTGTMLRRSGYHVLDAQNGGEAFLICEKNQARIDLLITDVVMPRMSGRELAERLREMIPGLRVVFVSGYTEDTAVHQGAIPGSAFVPKPTTPETLLRKVREILDAPPYRERS